MDDALTTAGRVGALIRATTPAASLQQYLEGRARLIAAVDAMRSGRPARTGSRLRTWMAVSFAAASIAVATFFVRGRLPAFSASFMATPAAPITWRLENGTVGAQGYVSIPTDAPHAHLVFGDGSDVLLSPGSRGRVAATTADGAEVVLEQGQARVHVVHRDRTSWVVDAGPFAVHVTGTDFLVAWGADTETLDVWMRSGRVVVGGPVLGDAQPLIGGQHLRARIHDATVLIDAAPEPVDGLASTVTRQEPVLTGVGRPMRGSLTNASPEGSGSPTSSWSKLVATGDFARVLQEAEAEGVGRAIRARPLADLRALGDAARYANNASTAKKAYLSLRSRFAAGTDARTAAFLLGRFAEEQDHSSDDAIRWYDKYLAEAPGGEFAGNALGRKMLLVARSQGRDAARSIAERYLQRFPGGPYEAAAHDLFP
jgi:hypothetical protein